jgi:hypothetical protein
MQTYYTKRLFGDWLFYMANTKELLFFLPTIIYDVNERDISFTWVNFQIGIML